MSPIRAKETIMKRGSLLLPVLMLMLVGCEQPSMNKRVGLTDGVVSVAVAVALDEVSADKYEASKVELVKTCEDMQIFLQTGQISDLPVADVEKALLAYLADKGLGKYSSIVRSLFDYVESLSVDTGKLGPDNLILLQIGLQEALDATARHRADWRPTK